MHGKPLLAWTIEAARASHRLEKYIVSTEDPEIAAVARCWGGEVLARPVELATDETPTLDVLQHVLEHVPATVLVLLQATCPIRDSGLIDYCVERFLQSGVDSLATGFICKYLEYGKAHLRRQDIPGFFYDDGNVYVMHADMVRKGDRIGSRIEKILLDREQNIDIDDEFDFWLAEQVLIKRTAITTSSRT